MIKKPLDGQTPVKALAGVGPQTEERLKKLHIHTVADVLFHLPLRYEDRTRVTPIAALVPRQAAVVVAQVEHQRVVFGRRRSLVVSLSDGEDYLTLRLFYFNKSQQASFANGKWVRLFGEVSQGPGGLEVVHPEYRVFEKEPQGGLDDTLTPVYPTVEGLSQTFWRKLTDQALRLGQATLTELIPHAAIKGAALPQELADTFKQCSITEAVEQLHRPSAQVNVTELLSARTSAHRRLIMEELLAHHFRFRRAKLAREQESALPLRVDSALKERFLQQLSFSLTGAQKRVSREIFADLAKPNPSLRLVQGDVGSGKTVVAALAALAAVSSGAQVALMAPTELLAEQHFATLSAWLTPLDIPVTFLASKVPAKLKNERLSEIASGDMPIVVGTHALIQTGVAFANLGLIIIDEQHRFGVAQRMALRDKAGSKFVPHQLALTATPIPRSLAMTFYAELSVSAIDEMPPGRQPIETTALSLETRRETLIERVVAACRTGVQAYWVCPLIEESEALEAQAATAVADELSGRYPDLTIGLIHGRLKADEKEAVMSAFRDGEINLLVATTVIEVGVDVPNASLMIIENAERLGLAQLHQLRGRVGRGAQQSFCVLLYQTPLSRLARERIEVLRSTNDGFVIAEKDLEIRGAGEILGTRQTGSLSFRVADIMRDQSLIQWVEPVATALSQTPEFDLDALLARWIGEREDFANA